MMNTNINRPPPHYAELIGGPCDGAVVEMTGHYFYTNRTIEIEARYVWANKDNGELRGLFDGWFKNGKRCR